MHRLQVALSLRRRLYEQPYYRLVYGESDELPGLVIDRYDDVCVAQIGTAGMERLKGEIAAALEKVIHPAGLLWKNDSGARDLEGLPEYVETAFGTVPERATVAENGLQFSVPLAQGQKTGWFFDQALNRATFLKYVPGARVLDVFSYLGAWAIAAARHGATDVTCIESSPHAVEWLQANAISNGVKLDVRKGDAFDLLEALHAARERFDVVVLDPPAFIKRRKDAAKGQAAYRRLNQLGLQLLSRDGMLVSCSCSYHLSGEELLAAIQKAARHVNRFVQVIESGGQAPDHPVHPGNSGDPLSESILLPCRAGLRRNDSVSRFRPRGVLHRALFSASARSGSTGTESCTSSGSSPGGGWAAGAPRNPGPPGSPTMSMTSSSLPRWA